MTLQLQLDPATEESLSSEARRQGISVEDLARRLLAAGLGHGPNVSEARLLQQIGEGWPASRWDRYDALVERRDQGLLTEHELRELTDSSEELERMAARRLEALARLSVMRGTDLRSLMSELGVGPRRSE